MDQILENQTVKQELENSFAKMEEQKQWRENLLEIFYCLKTAQTNLPDFTHYDLHRNSDNEFFIASSSCKPGGCRYHSNILLRDFNSAVKFAQNFDAYDVLFYTWEMFIYHYRLDSNGQVILEKTINLND